MAAIISPEISDYLLAHCTPADDVLQELAAATAATFPDAAGMQISHDEGELLTMLVRLVGARHAVEVGVFTGYSAICIARGLPKDGRLLACDVSAEWTALARPYWQRAEVEDRIELRIAPAAETLRALPPDPIIDFAFIDADKVGYQTYYEELLPRMRPGGVLVLDNVLQGGHIVEHAPSRREVAAMQQMNDHVAQDDRVESVMLPVRDGVTLIRKR